MLHAGPMLYLLFFLSGASGLIYQVVWVRQFGNVFGNTVYSASVVTATFMVGLGVGGYLAGVWSDRRSASDLGFGLRTYAHFELGIAAFGLILAVVLGHVDALPDAFGAYTTDERGWHYLAGSYSALRYFVAVLMLAPITILMGGTLTLLIRHIVAHDLDQVGFRIGLLYGVNTAGAAAGCFMNDFLLVPAFGLFGTQALAVSLNLLAGLGASVLSRRFEATAPPAVARPATPVALPVAQPGASRTAALVTTTIFITGFVGMGMEIVWFRHLISMLGGYRYVFSMLLGTILVGLWLGSMAGGLWHGRFGRPVLGYALAQALMVLSLVVGLTWTDGAFELAVETRQAWSAAGERSGLFLYWMKLKPILLVVGGPAFFMGVAFPLANAIVQQTEASVGARAGTLYLANTLGAVTGALLAGFVLLPGLGIQASVTVCLLASLLSIGLLFMAARGRPDQRPWPIVASGLAAAGGLAFWLTLPSGFLLEKTIPWARLYTLLTVSEGINETVAILEEGEGRGLVTNGHHMSGTSFTAQRYMRAFVHVPFMHVEAPERALVICFGVGNTAHAASLHPELERLEIVDLSENVLQHAGYFADTNRDVLKDPRVRIYVNDGRHHLRMQREGTYDLITLEPPPITHAGVSGLYSVEFYRLAKSRLKEGGLMTQWLPAYMGTREMNESIIRAFIEAFPQSVLLSGERSELILMGINGDRLEIDPDRVAQKLRANPRLREDLEGIQAGTPTELIGMFASSAETLRRVTEAAPPVSDDFPIMEYASISNLRFDPIPPEIFQVHEVQRWCPKCFRDGVPHPEVPHLQSYLEILAAFYTREGFGEEFRWAGRVGTALRIPATPEVKRAVEASPYLQRLLKRSQDRQRP